MNRRTLLEAALLMETACAEQMSMMLNDVNELSLQNREKRARRLAELRRAVADQTYAVPSAMVAQGIIQEACLDFACYSRSRDGHGRFGL